jgi:hypothetical protein
VLGASALDEVLCSGSGVDLGRVLAGSAPLAGPGTASRVLGRMGRRWLLRAVGPRRVWRLTDCVSEASSRQVADTAAGISEKGLEPGYPLKRRSLCCPCPVSAARENFRMPLTRGPTGSRTARKYNSNASDRERPGQAATGPPPAPTTATDLAAESSHRGAGRAWARCHSDERTCHITGCP